MAHETTASSVRTAESTRSAEFTPRRRSRVFTWLTGSLLGVALLVYGFSFTGLSTRVPVLFVFSSFRNLATIVVTVLAALFLVALWRRRPVKRLPRVIAALVVVVGAVVATVGIAAPAPLVSTGEIPRGGDLRVLSWNTNQLDVSDEVIDELIDATSPDIVVLTEYFPALAEGRIAAQHRDLALVASESSSVSAFISRDLGNYGVVDTERTPAWAGFSAASDSTGSPRLIFPHLERPTLTGTDTWNTHVEWVSASCERDPDTVIIGDFNATRAELGERLGRCTDVSARLGQQQTGSWPTLLPAALGAPIDHVYAGDSWRPGYVGTLAGYDAAGSDHRPIFAILHRATGSE